MNNTNSSETMINRLSSDGNVVVANVYRVYDDKLLSDPDFMAGWRVWSFYQTREGEMTGVTAKDRDLIFQMKQKGRELNNTAHAEWNRFRSTVLSIFPPSDPRIHYHDQYRTIFKRLAFVVVDCCFAIKYKMDSKALRELLADMFKATGSDEEPTYFIFLDNHITESEFDHKLNQFAREEYRGTQDKIVDYLSYHPKLATDRIAKMRVPFGVTHNAMCISERKVRQKTSGSPDGEAKKVFSRAGINDFSLIFMMDKIRRSFGLCARVALLTDDFGMIYYASTFYAGGGVPETGIYPNLPREYLEHYIVTPALLEASKWNKWRREDVHTYFMNHIADA